MTIHRLNSHIDAAKLMEKLGVDRPGITIMSKKCEVMLFLIKDLHVGAANILKQDALSIGADVALPNGTITCAFKSVDVLLMGTRKHIEILSRKELAQPYGLKYLAKELQRYLKKNRFETKIMGIINANDDSFYPKSRFQGKKAIEAIEKMIADGADIIDIGGMSTRPGSEEISEEEELARVKPIIDILKEKSFDVLFSIDTYRPKVAEYALQNGFHILNDITGLENDELAQIASAYGATVVIMHKKGRPKDMQNNPSYEDVVVEVSRFFEERIEKANRFGIKNIILDPGIGFGKRLQDNIELIRDLSEFTKFGYEILVGASRKSMIDAIVPSSVQNRLPGTLAIHLKALQNGASIIRCHDVKEHHQAITVYQALEHIG
ncbi:MULTISPECIES: dihydropteroate synthase [unclassified Nitratiruptor]|uniref:dihydropteroate synthase n=1 Tax=unclassified Nitratiruptor TaxID=2624044 RepID=UPI00191628F2|nr:MULTISPECIES: dihydropteroate synthase [unclassified Nitratiruptor]BCD60140.1 dihydropteroate synthase [Nitratiruptor sp. YY08-10]BCD64371.1 dihydropteroate synthase [Nitratiruptor sp. YY08-14]